MQIIINGTVYDTDTAAELAMHHENRGDLNYCHSALYLNEDGKFFQYYVENFVASITPLTYEEAKRWAETYFPEKPYETVLEKPKEVSYLPPSEDETPTEP